jgi:hypothetical protein
MVFGSSPRTRIELIQYSSKRALNTSNHSGKDGCHSGRICEGPRGSGRGRTPRNASEWPGYLSIRAVTRARSASRLRRANSSIHRPKREVGGGSISESAALSSVILYRPPLALLRCGGPGRIDSCGSRTRLWRFTLSA